MNSKKEKILKNINPKLLELTPKLSLVKGSFVDLDSDTDTLEKGAKELMKRFFKKQELFFKNISSEESIELSDGKYRDSYNLCRLISQRLSLPFFTENGLKLDTPGKKYQDLKKKLEDEMSAKREEDYRKRIIEYNLWKNEQKGNGSNETKNFRNIDTEGIGRNIVSSKNFDSEKCHNKITSQKQNGDIIFNEVNDKPNDFDSLSYNKIEDKNIDYDSKSNVDEGDYSSDEYSLIPPYQPGGGLMYGGSELTQPDEELPINLLSPSLKFQVNESQSLKESSDILSLYSQEKKENFCLPRQKLFTTSQNPNDGYDLNDALEFCSGKFPMLEQDIVDISDKADCQENSNTCTDSNDFSDKIVKNMESINNAQDKTASESTKPLKRIILLEDSEEEKEESKNFEFLMDKCEKNKNSISPVTEKNDLEENSDEESIVFKSKRAKHLLHFSDEEDETSDGQEDEEENDTDKDIEVIRSVHYDSEENEIINPKDFFDKEAELSGSEWSGDEDEQGLDNFDEEDGDAEEFDYEQIKSQLEKIHLRHLLDKDSKNIRLLQEFFFEDGDLHSDEKYKKFKWRNLGKEKNKDAEEAYSNCNLNDIASSDDEDVENIEVRKERLERQLLQDKIREGQEDSTFDDDLFKKIFRNLKVTNMKTAFKIDVENKKMENMEKDSKNLKTNISSIQNVRGSFLRRNEEFLSKLAKVISNVSDNVKKPNNSKNFVFATKSPEKTKTNISSVSKRILEDVDDFQATKKLKTRPKIMETSPFILDLLS